MLDQYEPRAIASRNLPWPSSVTAWLFSAVAWPY